MPDINSLPTERILLTWKAPLKPHIERGKNWYIVAGIIIMIFAAYGVLSGSWTVALIAVLCGAMYFLIRDHKLPDSTVIMTELGTQIQNTFMKWEDTKGYWLLITPEHTELHLVPKAPRREMIIEVQNVDLMTLKQTIETYIPELKEKRERFLDAFIRLCKL